MTDIRGDAADGGLAPDVQVGDVGGGGDTDPSDTGGDGAAVACTSAEALTAAESAAYFPFRVGARWTFRSAGRTNSAPTGPRLDYYAANGTKMIAGATAVAVTGPQQPLYPPQLPTVDEYYEVTAEGLVFRGSSLPPDKVIQGASRVYAAPFTAIPFPIRACTYMPTTSAGLTSARTRMGMGRTRPSRRGRRPR
jgi:hypothetical protein